MSKLSSEECEILEAFEKGKLKRSKKATDTQKRHQEFQENPLVACCTEV
jgi:hypothetical protein